MSRRRLRVAFLTTDNPLGYSGIDRYTSDLLRELALRTDLEVIPVTAAGRVTWLREHVPGIDEVITTRAGNGIRRSAEERYRLRARLARAHIDVVHGTKHILPWRSCCPTVLTLYDLFVFTRGRDYRAAKRLLLPIVYRQSIACADRVIALTESIRRQLVDLNLVDGANVDVVPAAPSTALTTAAAQPIAALAEVPFALCVGDLSPRKNVETLLRIWPAVHRQTKLVLAFVGPDRSRSEAIRARISSLQQSGAVARVGEATDGALRWCYENAQLVVIPSFEEGYGLPAIEAGFFGADLLTSTDPALVEVTGGSVQHLDAGDAGSWERAIVAAARTSERSSTPGAVRNWSEVAELTADVYGKAAAASN
jgi:glycosyltransferase involved in cell wall biosynthesis